MIETHSEKTVLVTGEGWAALAAVAGYASQNHSVCWVPGTGSRLLSPFPFISAKEGTVFWGQLMRAFDIDASEVAQGCFLREFRNKGFREPVWAQAPTPGDREEVFKEWVPESERALCSPYDARFLGWSFLDLEEELRTRVLAHPNVKRLEGQAITEIQATQGGGEVTLGSGQKISFARAVFADRWNSLREIQGLPKTLISTLGKWRIADLEKKLEPQSVLQMVLQHDPVVGAQVGEGFMIELNREAGEAVTKRAYGGFSAGGRRSLWTLVLNEEETADHALIAKRLRRIKQALAKVFVGPEWHGSCRDFLATVTQEAVRLEENVIFASGNPKEFPLQWEGAPVVFLTDGFGPSVAGELAANLGAEPQAEAMNLTRSTQT